MCCPAAVEAATDSDVGRRQAGLSRVSADAHGRAREVGEKPQVAGRARSLHNDRVRVRTDSTVARVQMFRKCKYVNR